MLSAEALSTIAISYAVCSNRVSSVSEPRYSFIIHCSVKHWFIHISSLINCNKTICSSITAADVSGSLKLNAAAQKSMYDKPQDVKLNMYKGNAQWFVHWYAQRRNQSQQTPLISHIFICVFLQGFYFHSTFFFLTTSSGVTPLYLHCMRESPLCFFCISDTDGVVTVCFQLHGSDKTEKTK